MKSELKAKAKAMAIGNRLAAHTGRSEAFRRAWKIAKAGGVELSVKGTSFNNRPEALRRLSKYSPGQVRAFIAPEKNNPADDRACAVYVGVNNGKGIFKIGYLPREYAPMAKSAKGAARLRVIGGGYGRGAAVRLAV